ncbi:MAG: flagellar basal-body rod protein FlgF [Defluviitaleaceae bacterium]|nr:flagellar basal-body rod protein FlgF [Defluviitaleaceae bacterium]
MVRGLYTSALGMITQMNRMDVVANNIANVDTTGYKRDQVVSQSFSEELMRRLNDPVTRMFKDYPIGTVSQGVYVNDIYTDHSAGSFRQTGSSLDLALKGQGFFSVTVNGEELYTRDGSFTLASNGALVTKDGGWVQGAGGDVILPNGPVVIDEAGRIFVNGIYIDTLKLTDFSDKHTLRKEKDNYYRVTAESQFAPFEGSVTQGFLENSNVSSVREMVEMIALSRAYETNSRMITVHDAIMARAVSEIGRR